MQIEKLPANSSRLFQTSEEAKVQPLGRLDLGIHPNGNYVFNTSFDLSKIHYDFNYISEDTFHFHQTLDYFSGLSKTLQRFNRIIEIGCGQGEFVEYLRTKGLNAFGFDPALRDCNKYLFNSLWSLNEENQKLNSEVKNTLYIMRCVLPHIPDPFEFLDNIFNKHPGAAVLIEFQNKEWIEQKKLWSQISHDHVNIFSKNDFENRYTITNSGDFSNHEWTYVLLERRIKPIPSRKDDEPVDKLLKIDDVFKTRIKEISLLVAASRPILIFGAAGKGIGTVFALTNEGVNGVYAFDSNIKRQGRYMECSGIRIITQPEIQTKLSSKTIILVVNPNHLHYVSNLFDSQFTLAVVGEITEKVLNI